MGNYWARQRFLITAVLTAALALITGLLFVYPCVERQAQSYNAQSVYKKTDVDFIAPEPSFEQVSELSGQHGIDKIFPYYLTKTQVTVNGKNRTETVLLSDQMENVEITMYNDRRIIEKIDTDVDNPLFVDWQFSHDSSAGIGDTVQIPIGGENVEYVIAAIYETNSIYDGGAILAEITPNKKEAIASASKSNGYSGMYISANDYNQCRSFLTTDYRPLGRLKSRDQFDSDEQYDIHFKAIMDSGYANEITDFRVKENNLAEKQSSLMVWLGAALVVIVMLAANIILANRGSEKGYFKKHCMPRGQNVKPYYALSFFFELVFFGVVYAVVIMLRIKASSIFIPDSALGMKTLIVPLAVIVAEIICLVMNNAKVTELKAAYEAEEALRRKQEQAEKAKAAERANVVSEDPEREISASVPHKQE